MPFALICSPETAVSESLRVLLGSEWTVFTETTVAGLRRLAAEVPADVIFLDEYVRDSELVDVVHALHRACPDSTLVALALSPRSVRVAAALPAGLDEVLTKPFDRDVLSLVLHRVHVRQHRRAARLEPVGSALVPIPAAAAPALRSGPTDRLSLPSALRALFRASTGPGQTDAMAQHVLEGLGELCGLNRGAIFWEREPGRYTALASLGLRRDRLDAVALQAETGLMAWLHAHNQICQRPVPAPMTLPTLVEQEMRLLQATMAIPLVNDGCLRGVLALGNKLTGLPFDAIELDVVLGVAQYATAMLDHAMAQQSARRQQALFEGVVQNLASGIVMIDTEGITRVLNETAARVLDVSRSASLGAPVERLGSLVGDLLRRTLAGETEYRRHRVVNPATATPLGVNTSRLRDGTGQVLGAIMVCTSLEHVEAQAEAPAVDEMDTWRRFALGMAHAIKNPLVAIKTFAQLYPDHHNEPDFSENFHAVALNEVERLDGLVETLMQYGDGTMADREPCDLVDLLADVVALETAETNGDAPVDVEQTAGSVVTLGDRVQLGEAIAQMLTNAREAAGRDGRVWVRVRGGDDDVPRAVIEVEDSGPGFPADAGNRVFSPFFTTKDKGLGLGLALAERVAHRHGGSMRISQSAEHGGALVALELPLARVTTA